MAYQNQKVKARQTVTSNQQTQTLGVVTNVPMGEWNSTTQYQKLNMVRSHEATYQAKKSSVGIEPTVTAGWQEVWQVVAYDGGAVEPTGTYPDMTVGNATNARNDGTGKNIAEQFETINSYIPSSTSAENQLADKAFVNSSINNFAAFYITYNQTGDKAFPTRADLLNATTFYSGGKKRIPTQNDYAIVLADESQSKGVDGSYPTTRYSYQGGTYPNGQWDFQYIVNNTSLTQAQVDAINSGITKELVEQIIKSDATRINNLLGAFDTISSDGKTITRQTGYLYGNDLIQYEGDLNGTAPYPNANIRYSIPNWGGEFISNSEHIVAIYGVNSDSFNIETNTQWNNFEEFQNNVLSGMVIQYKLATPYTESVYDYFSQLVRKEPQEFVVEEWNKSSNLFDDNTIGYYTGTDAGQFDVKFSYLPAGTYTIAFPGNKNVVVMSEVNVYNDDTKVTEKINVSAGGVGDEGYPSSKTFIATQPFNRIRMYALASAGDGQRDKIKVMLNKGSQPLPYQPYMGQIVHKGEMFDVLRVDPNKLEPTTANGWTIGNSSSLQLPGNGVYLIAVNDGENFYTSAGIMLLSGNDRADGSILVSYSINNYWYFISVTRIGTSWYWDCRKLDIGRSGYTMSSVNNLTIAYKKIA